MKKILILSTLLITFVSASSALTITNFGTGSWTPASFGNDFTVSDQSDSSVSITGNAANAHSGTLTSSADLTGAANQLILSGSFSTGSGALSVVLFDSGFTNTVTYTGGSFADLVNLGSTIVTFIADTGVDFSDIAALQIIGAGAPSTTVTGSFTDLSSVPEPSSFAFFAGALGLGFASLRRRVAR